MWKRFLKKFETIMQGRYGVDHFTHFLLFVACALMIVQIFVKNQIPDLILNGLALLVIAYAEFRFFSKNHYKRYEENQKYLVFHNKVKFFLMRKKSDINQRKNHKIFKCPKCNQSIRVPKGKGKIAITCPKCSTEFIRRS